MKIIAKPKHRRTGNVHILVEDTLHPHSVARTATGDLVIKTWMRAPNSTAEYSIEITLPDNEALRVADRATF